VNVEGRLPRRRLRGTSSCLEWAEDRPTRRHGFDDPSEDVAFTPTPRVPKDPGGVNQRNNLVHCAEALCTEFADVPVHSERNTFPSEEPPCSGVHSEPATGGGETPSHPPPRCRQTFRAFTVTPEQVPKMLRSHPLGP
jgi:hypothetical protein